MYYYYWGEKYCPLGKFITQFTSPIAKIYQT